MHRVYRAIQRHPESLIRSCKHRKHSGRLRLQTLLTQVSCRHLSRDMSWQFAMHSFLSSLTGLTQYQVIPIAKQDCPRVQHAWTPRSHNTFNILENLRSPRDRRINALPTLATCFAKSMSVSEWLPRLRLQDYIYICIYYIYIQLRIVIKIARCAALALVTS